MLRQASRFDDWLVCMVSSKIDQAEAGFDEVLTPADADFPASGLKAPSVLRLSRLAVLDGRSGRLPMVMASPTSLPSRRRLKRASCPGARILAP